MDDPRFFSRSELKWFAAADELRPDLYPRYLEVLASTPHKVDVLIEVEDLATTADLIERLAVHPKIRTIILAGVPHKDRAFFAAEAVLGHVPIRFCDGDTEKRMLLTKRRSQVITLEPPLQKLFNPSEQHPHVNRYGSADP
ncbi:MAG TPA: hypothetical protein VMT34_17205 [Aggregatilineales bacterium]|nr:hypothetical protein [Aggregatilineales bacterium]